MRPLTPISIPSPMPTMLATTSAINKRKRLERMCVSSTEWPLGVCEVNSLAMDMNISEGRDRRTELTLPDLEKTSHTISRTMMGITK